MKIALIQPNSGSQTRGIGIYARCLYAALREVKDVSVTLSPFASVIKGADLYHFTYFDPFFLTLPFFRQKRTVVTIHDLIPIKFPKHFPKGLRGSLKWQIQKHVVGFVDAIITDSENSAIDIKKYIHPIHRVYTVPLAPDPVFYHKHTKEEITKIKKRYNLPQEFLLYVGDINWNKNVPSLIQAVKSTPYALVVVSKALFQAQYSSHPEMESYEKAKAALDSTNQIQVLGFMESNDLACLYKAAKAFIFPSFYEGFGLPVVEAFVSGCPVITTQGGSLRELAQDAAMQVDPYSIGSISRAIGKIMKDDTLRKDLVERGFQRATDFSWKKTAQNTREVYKRVLSK